MALKRRRLAQRRKALGHNQDDLAILVGVGRTTVVRWERAETDPQPWVRRKLAAVLRVSAQELSELLDDVSEVPGRRDGYALRSSVPLDFATTTPTVTASAEGFSAHDLASRRQVLAGLSVLTSATLLRPIRQWAATPSATANGPLGPDDLDELRNALKLFRRWDASGVGGLQRKAVVGQLNAVAESVHETTDATTRANLLSILAELAQLAGWMAYDHGLPGVAQRYYLLALHACREVGSEAIPLGVKVIGDMTQISTSVGNYDDSLNLARTGLYALPRTEKLVRAELLGLESRAYAQLGPREASDAARSAEACVEVWHEAESETPPDWLDYMNQAEVDCLAANTFTRLALQADDRSHWREYSSRAEYHTLRARQTRTDGYDRSRILDEIRLAKVRLSQRELADALAVATDALHLARSASSSIVHDWLIRFYRELTERHEQEVTVREFSDQLRDYLRKVAPLKIGEIHGDNH